jgi:tetratricopeptide (TPR) repeat protein
MVWVLPWMGVALAVLHALYIVEQLPVGIFSEGAVQRILKVCEKGAAITVRIFVYSSLLLYANAKLDPSTLVDHPYELRSVNGSQIDMGLNLSFALATLESGEPAGVQKVERVLLGRRESQQLWAGERVVASIRSGYFGLPWMVGIERDDEFYAREVLALTPTATEAWRSLIRFYLGHYRWDEAKVAGEKYLQNYPHDTVFISSIGHTLSAGGKYGLGIPFLEHVVQREPNSYEAYQQLGWALNWAGQSARAAEVLETSIPLNPDDSEVYYHLGYVYEDMGEPAKAITMFEKYLERLPGSFEVEEKILTLRKQLAWRPIRPTKGM